MKTLLERSNKKLHFNQQSRSRQGEPFFKMTGGFAKQHYKAGLLNAETYILYIITAHGKPGWRWTFDPKKFCVDWEIPRSTFYRAITKLHAKKLINWEAKGKVTVWLEADLDASNPYSLMGETGSLMGETGSLMGETGSLMGEIATPTKIAETLDITGSANNAPTAPDLNQINTNSSSDIALAIATPISHPNEELDNSKQIKEEASQGEVTVPPNASCQRMSQTNSLASSAQLSREVQQTTTQSFGTECSAAPPCTDESPADPREKWLRQKALTLPKPIAPANLERWVRSQLLPENWHKWQEDYATDRPAPQYEPYPEGFEEKVQQWRSSGVSVGICYNGSRLEIKTKRYTMSAAEFMEMPIEPLLEKPDPNFHTKVRQLTLMLGSRKKEKN